MPHEPRPQPCAQNLCLRQHPHRRAPIGPPNPQPQPTGQARRHGTTRQPAALASTSSVARPPVMPGPLCPPAARHPSWGGRTKERIAPARGATHSHSITPSTLVSTTRTMSSGSWLARGPTRYALVPALLQTRVAQHAQHGRHAMAVPAALACRRNRLRCHTGARAGQGCREPWQRSGRATSARRVKLAAAWQHPLDPEVHAAQLVPRKISQGRHVSVACHVGADAVHRRRRAAAGPTLLARKRTELVDRRRHGAACSRGAGDGGGGQACG